MKCTIPVAALLALIACTHSQAWVASGESLSALGEAFVTTGHAMDAALESKAVTTEQYRKWAAFSKYFKPAYDLAAERWLQADDEASQHAAAVLAALSAELAKWTSVANGGK